MKGNIKMDVKYVAREGGNWIWLRIGTSSGGFVETLMILQVSLMFRTFFFLFD
jgi:hypothetical protein